MTGTTTQGTTGAAPARGGALRVRRAVAVVLATLAAVLVWVVAVPLAGADLLVEAPDGSSAAVEVSAFVASTLTATLLGWALLELLERFTGRPRRVWTIVALVFLLVSFAGPLGMPGIETADRLWLALGHVVVAAVFVPLMARTARPDRR